MDEAAELGNYLPLSFETRNEQEYIAFLWDAFETNYTHSKYQFAFLAYHMLTMSFVYFNIWQTLSKLLAGDSTPGSRLRLVFPKPIYREAKKKGRANTRPFFFMASISINMGQSYFNRTSGLTAAIIAAGMRWCEFARQ